MQSNAIHKNILIDVESWIMMGKIRFLLWIACAEENEHPGNPFTEFGKILTGHGNVVHQGLDAAKKAVDGFANYFYHIGIVYQRHVFMLNVNITATPVGMADVLHDALESFCRTFQALRTAPVQKSDGALEVDPVRYDIALGAAFNSTKHDGGGFKIADLPGLDHLYVLDDTRRCQDGVDSLVRLARMAASTV